jgi:superfamily II DNA/RNA helicase
MEDDNINENSTNNNINLNNLPFTQLQTEAVKVKISVKVNDYFELFDFNDIKFHYDDDNHLHLKLRNKDRITEHKIFHLDENLIDKVLYSGEINNARDNGKITMSEFITNYFLPRRNPVVEEIRSGISRLGHEIPTAVQRLSIPYIIQGRDMIIQFPAGSGKSLAILIGTFCHFYPKDDSLQFIIITSTHEVAEQFYKDSIKLLPSAAICLCIGNKQYNKNDGGFKNTKIQRKSLDEQIREIKNAQIIIGTMGKIYEAFSKKWIYLDDVKSFVIDEFDTIIYDLNDNYNRKSSYSTVDQSHDMLSKLPSSCQRIFLSATADDAPKDKACTYFREKRRTHPYDPVVILINTENVAAASVKQYYQIVRNETEKLEFLMTCLQNLPISQCIIFVNQVKKVNVLFQILSQMDYPCKMIHGQLSGDQRKEISEIFRRGTVRYLISTDISARGLDINGINVVINYDMPDIYETYIHRVGRAGRAGKRGVSISIISPTEIDKIKQINNEAKTIIIKELKNIKELLV